MKICELEAHSFFENQHFSTKIREIEAQSLCENKVVLTKYAVPFGVSTGCLTVRRVQWVQPFPPAHNLIIPQPRSSLPYRRRIHNLVAHQRRSPLPCRRSILLRRSASLHRSRTGATVRARGLALLRNLQGCQRGLSVILFFLSGFSFLSCFSSFSSRHLVFVPKKSKSRRNER